MNKENLTIAIKRLSDYKTNDKAGYWYMLQCINHKVYFYQYAESYTRKQILALLIEEIQTEQGWAKLVKLNTYRDLQETETLTVINLDETENITTFAPVKTTIKNTMKTFVGIIALAASVTSCTTENVYNNNEPIKQNIEDYQKPDYVNCTITSNLSDNDAKLYLIDWSKAKPDTILKTSENTVNIPLVKRRLYEVAIRNKQGGTKTNFNELTVKMKADTICHVKTGNYSSGLNADFFVRK